MSHGSRIVNCRDLWDTNTGNHPRRADRARADADFNHVNAGVKQRLGSFTSCYVTSNQRCFWEMFANFGNLAQYPSRVTMGRVDNDRVSTSLQQCFSTLERVGRNPNGSGDQQMAVFVNGSAVEV